MTTQIRSAWTYCDCNANCTSKRRTHMKPIEHGTVTGAYAHGCRCQLCISATLPCKCNPNCKAKRSKDYEHGTLIGYRYHGCRCSLCKEFNANRNKDLQASRHARLNEMFDKLPHGETSTYLNWGCRCAPCTKSQSISCRVYAINTGRIKNPKDWDAFIDRD